MFVSIVLYRLKLFEGQISDIHLLECDTECFTELDSIIPGTTGGTKSRHRYSDDIATLLSHNPKGFMGREEGEGGVESTRDTDDGFLDMCVCHTLDQTMRLYVDDLITTV